MKQLNDPGLADAADQELLARLALAPRPVGLAEFFGRTPRVADRVRLARLLASGHVVNLGGPRFTALATAEDAAGRLSPMSLARLALKEHLGATLRPLGLSASALAKVKAAPYVKSRVRDAAGLMVREGELIPLKVGNSALVISTAGVQQYLQNQRGSEATAPSNQPRPSADHLAPASVDEQLPKAYRAVLRPGASMVEIGALQREMRCPLPEVHGALSRLVARRQAFLVLGDPVLLLPADREAGMNIGGATYYCVELSQE